MPERVLTRRRAEREALLGSARDWVRSFAHRILIDRAVVFGSVARGDFNRWSDVDLLLISAGFEGSPLRRLEQLGDRPPRVQPVCWTPAEWHAERQRGNPIALEADQAGVNVGEGSTPGQDPP